MMIRHNLCQNVMKVLLAFLVVQETARTSAGLLQSEQLTHVLQAAPTWLGESRMAGPAVAEAFLLWISGAGRNWFLCFPEL